MLHSVRCGIASYAKDPPEAYLVALGDQPFIQPETIRRVLEAFRTSALPICLPTYNGERGHPVVFAHLLVSEVMGLSADVGLRGMIYADPERVLEVAVEDSGIRRDLDTPADYARLGLGEA
jgi:molybdenum cofactor cytidylyltransferase